MSGVHAGVIESECANENICMSVRARVYLHPTKMKKQKRGAIVDTPNCTPHIQWNNSKEEKKKTHTIIQ